jgi:hypothetical protein
MIIMRPSAFLLISLTVLCSSVYQSLMFVTLFYIRFQEFFFIVMNR